MMVIVDVSKKDDNDDWLTSGRLILQPLSNFIYIVHYNDDFSLTKDSVLIPIVCK